MKQNLFIISGPSGAGEDSIIEGLKKYIPIERVITTTTRKMRLGEFNGNPYYFISKEKFQKEIKKNNFLEYAEEYNEQYYGVTKQEIDRIKNSSKIGIWKVEYQGVIAIKKIMPEIKSIFITAPLNILKKRIKSRGGFTEEQIEERMEYTKKWLSYENIYDYKIINQEGKLEEAIQKTLALIKKLSPM